MKILPIAIASLGLLSAQPGFEVVSVKPTPEERLKESRASKVLRKWPVLFCRFSRSRAWESGYDIDAKSAAPVSRDQCRLMVRSLLADRFQMKAHRETHEMRGYALVAGA
jgi:hypothetical protein